MTELASGARITGQVRADLTDVVAQRYRSGESIRAIAADLGRSYGFIQRLLSEAKVEIRARGGDTRSTAARTRQAEVETALAQARGESQEGQEPKAKKVKQKSKNKVAKAKDKDAKGKPAKDKDDKGKAGKDKDSKNGKGKDAKAGKKSKK